MWYNARRFHAFARVDCDFVLGHVLSPRLSDFTFFSAIPGSISEGSRTTLFGSSTSVAVFSPITARRTTVEPREGSETVTHGEDAGSHARFASCQPTTLPPPPAPVPVDVFLCVPFSCCVLCVAVSCVLATAAIRRVQHRPMWSTEP